MTTLVIAAHPDDEVLGCGATMARRAEEGEDVHVVILGEGSTSRSATRDDADPSAVDELVLAGRRAADCLGVSTLRHVGLPDNRFDQLDLLDIVKSIEEIIAEVRPELVLTHHPSDLNVDHQLAFRATLTATRPMPGRQIAEVLSFEVLSSSEWTFGMIGPAFRPTVFVDVVSTIDKKILACEAYGSEMRPYPHPRSPECVRGLAALRGASVGLVAAEAFEMVRAIR